MINACNFCSLSDGDTSGGVQANRQLQSRLFLGQVEGPQILVRELNLHGFKITAKSTAEKPLSAGNAPTSIGFPDTSFLYSVLYSIWPKIRCGASRDRRGAPPF